MKGKGWFIVLGVLGLGCAGWQIVPSQYNPFAPLSLDASPGRITQFKLRRLPAQQCTVLLGQANRRGWITSRQMADSGGPCPLKNVVRVTRFGRVRLSSSFLASCPLALSSTLFVQQQAMPLAEKMLGSALSQIDHLGSFACRNIYHRENARLSEHAGANALDISGFRLMDGRRLTVLHGWKQPQNASFLRSLLSASCLYYGNGLGPNYNAAHANHFHLGMRGYGLCR